MWNGWATEKYDKWKVGTVYDHKNKNISNVSVDKFGHKRQKMWRTRTTKNETLSIFRKINKSGKWDVKSIISKEMEMIEINTKRERSAIHAG